MMEFLFFSFVLLCLVSMLVMLIVSVRLMYIMLGNKDISNTMHSLSLNIWQESRIKKIERLKKHICLYALLTIIFMVLAFIVE
jgi:uncharacterized membrane protein SpoIIM required for sporulation